MEARSLVPALRGDESWEPREYVFAEQGRDGNLNATEFVTMVRSERWKLVHFLGEPHGQLFDLQADPQENRNLWNDPACGATKAHLHDVLREWRIRSALQTKDCVAGIR